MMVGNVKRWMMIAAGVVVVLAVSVLLVRAEVVLLVQTGDVAVTSTPHDTARNDTGEKLPPGRAAALTARKF